LQKQWHGQQMKEQQQGLVVLLLLPQRLHT
jgi:hypothetical protein